MLLHFDPIKNSEPYAANFFLTSVSSLDLTSVSNFDLTSVSNLDLTSVSNLDLTSVSDLDLTSVSHLDLTSVSKFDLTSVTKLDFTSVSNLDLNSIANLDLISVVNLDLTFVSYINLTSVTNLTSPLSHMIPWYPGTQPDMHSPVMWSQSMSSPAQEKLHRPKQSAPYSPASQAVSKEIQIYTCSRREVLIVQHPQLAFKANN